MIFISQEVGDIEGQVRDTMECIEDLENKLSEASNGLNKVREDIQNLETKIADASIQKHKVRYTYESTYNNTKMSVKLEGKGSKVFSVNSLGI